MVLSLLEENGFKKSNVKEKRREARREQLDKKREEMSITIILFIKTLFSRLRYLNLLDSPKSG